MRMKQLFNLAAQTLGQRARKLIVVGLLIAPMSISAELEIPKHQQIIAGFLLHLTSFTQWQTLEGEDVQLCLMGPDPFKSYISAMVKRRPKNSSGKLIVLRYIEQVDKFAQDTCQIIYFSPKLQPLEWQVPSLMKNTLLVSQSAAFLEHGGMINFVLEDKRIQLEVNLRAVKDAGLKISSDLLKHAKIITDIPSQRDKQENDTHAKS